MPDDRYRKIERSKPSNPPIKSPRQFNLPLGLGRLFVRKRRAYAVLVTFFILGTAIGGYHGSASLTGEILTGPGNGIQNKSVSDTKPSVNVRVYAYKSPLVKNRTPTGVPAKDLAPFPAPQKRVGPRNEDLAAKRTKLPSTAAPQVKVKAAQIAIVIDDLGIDQYRTQRMIDLKAPLTLAFLPYGYNLDRLTRTAQAAGHELLVHLPMQPTAEDTDPGPKALVRGLSRSEIQERLGWNLSQFQGFVGINNHMGSSFSAWDEGMTIVLRELENRGLFYLDSLTSPNSVARRIATAEGIKILMRDIFLDNKADTAHITNQLTELERIARRRGYAIGIGHPYDATTGSLSAWLPTLAERGIDLVPLSHLQRQ